MGLGTRKTAKAVLRVGSAAKEATSRMGKAISRLVDLKSNFTTLIKFELNLYFQDSLQHRPGGVAGDQPTGDGGAEGRRAGGTRRDQVSRDQTTVLKILYA